MRRVVAKFSDAYTFESEEKNVIATALFAAREQYLKDAERCEKADCPAIAEHFRKQATDAKALEDLLRFEWGL